MPYPVADEIVATVLQQYDSLGFKPPPRQFTILAAFVLSDGNGRIKIVSLGTGSKCLPGTRLQDGGNAVHDSHAEVLARRGAIRWFLEEVRRVKVNWTDSESIWIEEKADGKFALRAGVLMHLYVSTLPCRPRHASLRSVQRTD
jgi:tRNA-specific adenosine deaminase 1